MIDVRKKLQDELNQIEYQLRVELPKEILRAREHGDLSENAEYKSAKERQAFLEGRKAQLQQRLASLSLINLDKIPRDRVAYGSRVVLYDYEEDKEIEYRLVSSEESDLSRGLISVTSPIGKSLLGKQVGEEAQIVTPAGRKEYEIRSLVTFQEREEWGQPFRFPRLVPVLSNVSRETMMPRKAEAARTRTKEGRRNERIRMVP